MNLNPIKTKNATQMKAKNGLEKCPRMRKK